MTLPTEATANMEPAERTAAPQAATSRSGATREFRFLVVFLIGAAVAFALQLHRMPAVFFEGEIVPADNDAFYHARRITDTVGNPDDFYQFDSRIHAPEGSLLVWPWGFDYTVAAVVRLAIALGLASDVHLALAYVPPFAVVISVAALTLLAWNLGLSAWATALLVLAVAASPLTQAIHGIGCIDHHFAEYMFILGFLAASIGWLRNPDKLAWPFVTGFILGVAPAMHTLLFILQLPLLLTFTLMWIRGFRLERTAALTFGVALLLSTAAVVAPSKPLHEGYFAHYYLSWFHVYVSACTAVVMNLLANWTFNRRNLVSLIVIGALLALPLFPQLIQAASYLDKRNEALSEIGEAKSVLRLLEERGTGVLGLYSGLILLAPAVFIWGLAAVRRCKDPAILLIAVYCLMAIPLLLSQFRFHYYGSICLILPFLLAADTVYRRLPGRQVLVISTTFALLVVMVYPAAKVAIASERMPGRDPYFLLTRLAMPALAEACKSDPGIVLAKNNEGHFIRYYTDCSVIANNFLLTEQHVQALYTVADLFNKTPEAVADSPIPIKYVLARARSAVADGTTGFFLVDKDEAQIFSDTLTDALLWSGTESVPPEFELIEEIPAPGKDYPYARIWKINRVPETDRRHEPESEPRT